LKSKKETENEIKKKNSRRKKIIKSQRIKRQYQKA